MTAINYLQGGLALILQVLIFNAMLRNGVRRYWPLFLYNVSLFLSTSVLMLSLAGAAGWSRQTSRFFWMSEVIQQALVFCTIISFIHQRMSSTRESKSPMTRWLIVGATVILLGILGVHRDPNINVWMTPVSRDLSFAATILNLLLWTVLLRDPKRNQRLLMVSGGLGVQLAGYAIGQGLRVLWEVSKVLATLGNFVGTITFLLSLYIIYRAFAQPDSAASESALSQT
ncbi:MAG: hypothetical protein JNK48_02945 [Bryobacterales bacterium]|nr:hypothetical protein [Bryobacterales bacterium]